MTFTYRRADTLVPVLQAPDHAYVIEEGERVWGVVAGSGSNWYAGPVSPSRTLRPPWTVRGESRAAAAELLTRGRP